MMCSFGKSNQSNTRPAALSAQCSGRLICRWVYLRVQDQATQLKGSNHIYKKYFIDLDISPTSFGHVNDFASTLLLFAFRQSDDPRESSESRF